VGDEEPVRRSYALSSSNVTVLASRGAFLDSSPFDGAVDGAIPVDRPASWRDRFDGALRERERELARTAEVPAASAPTARQSQVVPAPPAVGSTRDFRVLTDLRGSTFATSTARLRYVGDNILVYEDVGAPAPLARRDGEPDRHAHRPRPVPDRRGDLRRRVGHRPQRARDHPHDPAGERAHAGERVRAGLRRGLLLRLRPLVDEHQLEPRRDLLLDRARPDRAPQLRAAARVGALRPCRARSCTSSST
jgi:hypothetical protein